MSVIDKNILDYWKNKKKRLVKKEICVMIEELREQKMETEEERKRGRKVKIKVKKSHHIGTEPLLYVIHDRGLRYRDLWSKAKPRRSTKATQQQHPGDKNKDCHAQTQSNITSAKSKIKI